MNVYDFDHTIYDGDSTLDFFKHCLRKHPILILYIPKQVIAFFLYKLGIIPKLEFKQIFYGFLNLIELPEKQVEDFWRINNYKIKQWYIQEKKEDDVIISASPEFLLKPICNKMAIEHLIASKVNINTGQCLSENCFGIEKVKRFKEYFGEIHINEFYSDSLTDTPLATIAQKSFLVQKNTIVPWKYDNKTSKNIFFNREFLLFIIVGVINTFNGILFSYVFSFVIDNKSAFVLGYILSLFVSYLLNTKFIFVKKITFINFIKFCIAYIPNFLVQFILVLILLNYFGWHKLLVYAISATISVPITFLMVKFFALKK